MKAGTVEVVVLPPVSTTGWRTAAVGAHADQVRDMFLETLAHWPGRHSAPRPDTEGKNGEN
jgi:putative phosphoserine phosphatase/1-acylglycerol-3-phosphate O-acyltransferase